MDNLLRRFKFFVASPPPAPPKPKEAKWYLSEIGRPVRKATQIQAAVEATKDLNGMVVECGVAAAATLSLFAHILRRSGDNRELVGVDSFEGFPTGSEFDSPDFSPDVSHAHYRRFTKDFAYENLLRSGLTKAEADTVRLVKGWIPEAFKDFDGPISILHIDVDLYQPYRDALVELWPRVQAGGIVLFDEYDQGRDAEKWPGAKRAVDEFCAEMGLSVQKHWSGYAFLVKLRDSA